MRDSSWRGYGLGGLGAAPLCSGMTVDASFVGPVDCDPSAGPLNRAGNTTTISDPFGWFALDSGKATGLIPSAPAPAAGSWLQNNAVTVGISLALAAVVVGMVKR